MALLPPSPILFFHTNLDLDRINQGDAALYR